MSLPLICACLWVLAGTATAMLPMRYQYAPGLTLLLSAPVLVAWIAFTHGAWLAFAGVLAVLSMYRKPLAYLARRARGTTEAG